MKFVSSFIFLFGKTFYSCHDFSFLSDLTIIDSAIVDIAAVFFGSYFISYSLKNLIEGIFIKYFPWQYPIE